MNSHSYLAWFPVKFGIFFIAALFFFAGSTAPHAGTIGLVSGPIDTSAQPQAQSAALSASAGGAGKRALAFVQFDGPIQPEWRNEIQKAGCRIIRYYPENAYLVEMAPSTLPQVTAVKPVRWIGNFEPSRKFAPGLSRAKATARGVLDVTILSADKLPLDEWKQRNIRIQRAKATRMGWYDTRATVPVAELDAVAAHWSVFHLELQAQYEMHGERAAQTMAGNFAPGAGAPTGPGYSQWLSDNGLTGGSGQVFWILDDGIDQGDTSGAPGTAHPDLLGRIVGAENPGSDPTGDSGGGHGMLNAGIIAGNAAVGTADAGGFLLGQGVAPQSLIFSTKIFRNDGPFDIGFNSFTDLAIPAQNAGAVLSSNSWGAVDDSSYNADAAEFDAITRDADPNEPGNQEMIVVFSAGNAGPTAGSIRAPAVAKSVIAVGAANNSDASATDGSAVGPSGSNNFRDLIDFSSRGPTFDSRIKPDVVAVGTHVFGPASTSPNFDGSGVSGSSFNDFQAPPDDAFFPQGQTDYTWSSGTSHSCPVVSGASLLVREFLADPAAGLQEGPIANPSPALIRAILTNTATDMVGGNDDGFGVPLENIPTSKQGWGQVNLSTLFDMSDGLFIVNQETLLTASGQTEEFLVTPVDLNKPIKITLAWTDQPASPGANPTIINDLDLEVTNGGSTFLGNVFSGGVSIPGGSPDRRNTLESVFIPNPQGSFNVRVRGFNIAGDGVPGNATVPDQDFALFVWNGTTQSSRGFVSLSKNLASCSDSLDLLVSDADLKAGGSVTVNIAADSGDSENVQLIETGPDTGIFTASIATAAGAAAADGLLQIAHNDNITATYNDADDGSGAPAAAIAQATADCLPARIFDVHVSKASFNLFTVSFKTDEPSTVNGSAGLECGNLDNFVSSPLEATEHALTFSGLPECTGFRFQLAATDRAGNVAVNSNNGQCFSTITHVSEVTFEDDFDPSPQLGWVSGIQQGSGIWQPVDSGFASQGAKVFRYAPPNDGVNDVALVSPEFDPAGGTLNFFQTFDMEEAFGTGNMAFDGGVLEISTNGGPWIDLGPFISLGGYTHTMDSTFGNPLADGRMVWSGGTLGPMTPVQVDLSSFSGPARIRFRFASDTSIRSEEWQIDNVVVRRVEPCGDLNFALSDFAWSSSDFIPGIITATASHGPDGLCLNVPFPGDNGGIWISPEDTILLKPNTVYRATLNMSSDQPAVNQQPLWFFIYHNFHASTSNIEYGGSRWVLDRDGGANGILTAGRSAGRSNYTFFLTPNSVGLSDWNDPANPGSPFAPGKERFTGMRFEMRVLDLESANLNAQADAGTICLNSLQIEAIPLSSFVPQQPPVFNAPITNANYSVEDPFETLAGEMRGSALIDDALSEANIAMAVPGPNDVPTAFRLMPEIKNQGNENLRFYPIVWEADTIYGARYKIRADVIETDPPDIITLVFNTPNFELGQDDFTTASRSFLPLAASPKLGEGEDYRSFFYSHNVTASPDPTVARLRSIIDIFNRTDLIGDGAEPFTVREVVVEKYTIAP